MPSRRLRLVARVLVAVLLFVVVALAGGVYVLQRHSQALTAHVLEAFTAATGLKAEAASVDIMILPLPTVSIGEVRILGNGYQLSVAYASLRPDLWRLAQGELAPAQVQLLRPILQGRIPLDSLAALPAGASAGSGASLPALPTGMRLEVQQGQIDATARDGSRLQLANLHCLLDVEPGDRLSGTGSCSLLSVADGEKLLFSLRNAALDGKAHLFSPLRDGADVRARGQLRYGDWLRNLSADVHWRSGKGRWDVSGKLQGALVQSGQHIPFALDGTARLLEPGGRTLELQALRFALEADSGQLDGMLALGAAGGPQLSGHVYMNRLSLTQWLGFARDLVPGLRLALDNITNVSADFQLDATGLRVPSISAHCNGSRFVGSGGVPRWDKPVVTLELMAQQVNLGLAIPEAVGKRPAGPFFAHAPLTSFDPHPRSWNQLTQTGSEEEEDASATDDLGYDIRLSALTLLYGPLRLQNAHVRISPGKPASTGKGRALLEVRAALYGGTATAEATIGGGPATPEFDIAASLADIRSAALSEDVPALPLKGGRLQARANVRSVGGDVPAFLANLSGRAEVQAVNGSLGSLGSPSAARPLAYTSLGLNLQLRQGRLRQGRVGLGGAWKLTLDGRQVQADGRLDGMVWLGGSPRVALDNMESRLRLAADREFSGLPGGLELNVHGKLSAQAVPPQVVMEQADCSGLGAHYAGSLRLGAVRNGPTLRGSGMLRCDDVQRTLARVRETPPSLPRQVRALRVQGEWECLPGRFSLKKLSASLLNTDISGEMSVDLRETPLLRFALSTPFLDVDSLRRTLNPEGAAADARREEAIRTARANGRAIPPPPPAPEGTPWDLRFLKSFAADGSLHAGRMTSWKLTLTDVRTPIKLADGKLEFNLTANLYGALLRSKGHAQFDRGMRFSNQLSAGGFDLAAASAERGGDARVSGKASLDMTVSGAMNASGQVLRALDGTWKMRVTDGSHQSLREGRPKGKPTRFSLLSASGNIRQGVARSGDLSLRATDMTVRGSGRINLVDETLECQLSVDTPTMNNIPVRVYGSLHDVKTSISAGTVLLYAISGIAQGVSGLVGGLLDGALSLFR